MQEAVSHDTSDMNTTPFVQHAAGFRFEFYGVVDGELLAKIAAPNVKEALDQFHASLAQRKIVIVKRKEGENYGQQKFHNQRRS